MVIEMKSCDFRVRIKNYRNGITEYIYFDTESEAKSFCIAKSSMYLNTFDSYECTDDHYILYQIQYRDRFDGFIPDYGITINRTAFTV